MKLFSFIGNNHPSSHQEIPDDEAALDEEMDDAPSNRKQVLSRWLARRKIERMLEKKRLRASLEDYEHFTLDMVKERN